MRLQLPSANFLYRQIADTIRCFPFEVLFTIIGTLSAVALTDNNIYGYISNDWCLRFLMMGAIGLPFSFAMSLYVNSKAFLPFNKILLKCVAVVMVLIFLFLIKPAVYPQDNVHFVLIFLASHLLVSFAAYTGKNNTAAFWAFNRWLLSRLLTGLLYSLVLAIGLSAAFSAVNSLFGFNMDWNNIYKIWIIIFGLFNTLFVLSGFNQYTRQVQMELMYPRGLKLFSQYVLVPLATIFLIILLSYELKILVEWQSPKGMVSALILGYSGIGILALLLVYPIREKEGNGWIKVYSRYFYFFLLPLLALLLLAITKRINIYGITQYRYFVIALAIWLAFLAVYFLSYKKSNIKAIPVSLFLLIMLITYGPLSSTAVSFRSQKAVLLDLFGQAKAVRSGKLQPINEKKIKPYKAVRMAGTLSYILKNFNFEALQPLLSINLLHKEDSLRRAYSKYGNFTNIDADGFKWTKREWLQDYLGLGGYEFRQDYTQDQMENSILTNYYITCKETVSSIKGYDYMLVKDTYIDSLKTDSIAAYVIKQHEDFDQAYMMLDIGTANFKFSTVDLAKQIIKQTEKNIKMYQDQSVPQGLDKKYILPQKMLRITQQKANFEVTVQVQEMSFDYSDKEGVKISSVKAYYFIKIK